MPLKDIEFLPFITPMDYHYNPDDGLWYDVDSDKLPLPTTAPNIVKNFDIGFLNGNSQWDELNTLEDFKECLDEVIAGLPSAFAFSFVFDNPNGKKVDCYFVSAYLPGLTQFIDDISQNKFSFIYLEAYTDLKLLAWPVSDNQIRFVIQYYYPDDYGRDTEWKFLDRILDIQVDKQVFINTFNKAILQTQDTLKRLIQDFATRNNLLPETIKDLSIKMGLN